MANVKSLETATRFKEARLKAGIKSQAAAARAVGCTPSYMSNIESGRRAPNAELAEKIAAAYGVTVKDLLGEPAPAAPVAPTEPTPKQEG